VFNGSINQKKNDNLQVSIYDKLAEFTTNEPSYTETDKQQMPNNEFREWEDIVSPCYTAEKKCYTNYANNVPMEIKMHPTHWNSPRMGTQKSGSNYNPAGASMSSVLGGVGEISFLGNNLVKANMVLDQTEGQNGAKALLLRARITTAKVPGQLSNGLPKTDAETLSDLVNANVFGFVETNTTFVKKSYTDFTARPDSLMLYVKYTPKNSDKAVFEVLLHDAQINIESSKLPARYQNHAQGYKPVSENAIGYTRAKLSGMHSDWIRISMPIFYKDATTKPSYALLNITAGDGYSAKDGSVLIIDKIEFIYNN
jgi:hypothetical protein